MELNKAVLPDVKPEIHAFIDGKAGNKAVLMINMSAQGTHTIGAE